MGLSDAEYVIIEPLDFTTVQQILKERDKQHKLLFKRAPLEPQVWIILSKEDFDNYIHHSWIRPVMYYLSKEVQTDFREIWDSSGRDCGLIHQQIAHKDDPIKADIIFYCPTLRLTFSNSQTEEDHANSTIQ